MTEGAVKGRVGLTAVKNHMVLGATSSVAVYIPNSTGFRMATPVHSRIENPARTRPSSEGEAASVTRACIDGAAGAPKDPIAVAVEVPVRNYSSSMAG